jgi:hypothetical protein
MQTGTRCVDKRVLSHDRAASSRIVHEIPRLLLWSQQCRHNKEENERLHKICNDYKARKVNTRSVMLCCVTKFSLVIRGPWPGLRIAGDYRPAASVPAAAIQLEEASDSVANAAAAAAAAAATLIAGTTAAAGRIAANASAAASGRCLWTREPPAES